MGVQMLPVKAPKIKCVCLLFLPWQHLTWYNERRMDVICLVRPSAPSVKSVIGNKMENMIKILNGWKRSYYNIIGSTFFRYVAFRLIHCNKFPGKIKKFFYEIP